MIAKKCNTEITVALILGKNILIPNSHTKYRYTMTDKAVFPLYFFQVGYVLIKVITLTVRGGVNS